MLTLYFSFFTNLPQHQGEGVAAIGKAIGELWKALTPSDKEPYENQAAKEKMQYTRNKQVLSSLGDPKLSCTGTYTRILAALDSNERIPYVSVLGYDDTTTDNDDDGNSGEMLLYNFWKDSKNPKGLWRKTHYHPTSRPIQFGVLSSTLINWPRGKIFLGYGRGIQPPHVH